MNHLSVFLGICIGTILGLFVLGGHYFLMFLNILFPILFWIIIIYSIKKSAEEFINEHN